MGYSAEYGGLTPMYAGTAAEAEEVNGKVSVIHQTVLTSTYIYFFLFLRSISYPGRVPAKLSYAMQRRRERSGKLSLSWRKRLGKQANGGQHQQCEYKVHLLVRSTQSKI